MAKRNKRRNTKTKPSPRKNHKGNRPFNSIFANISKQVKTFLNQYSLGIIYGAIPLLLFWLLNTQFMTSSQKQILESGELLIPIVILAYFPLAILMRQYFNRPQIVGIVFLFLLFANLFISLPFSFLNSIEPVHFYLILAGLLVGGWYLALYSVPPNTDIHLIENLDPGIKKWIVPGSLGLVFIAAFLLRIWKYTDYGLWVDANNHIEFAYNFLNGYETEYKRASIISYLTTFMAWIGGADEYSEFIALGRIPSIFFGALTVIPIYFLGSKLSKFTGIIASFLWSIYPWAIGISLYIREYSLFILVASVAYCLLIDLLLKVVNYNRTNIKTMIFNGITLGFLLIYALILDFDSTLKVTWVTLCGLALGFFLIYTPFYLRKRKVKGLLHLGLLLIAAVIVIYLSRDFLMERYQKTNQDVRWFEVFFMTNRHSPIHWWGYEPVSRYFIFMVLPFGALLSFIFKKHKLYLVFLLSFFFFLLTYFYIADRYFRPKYQSYLIPVFTILMAGFIAGAMKYAYTVLGKHKLYASTAMIACGVMCFLIFNPKNAIETKFNPPYQNGYLLTCGEYHYNYRYPKWVLDTQVTDFRERKIITTVYKTMLRIDYDIDPAEIQNFNVQNRNSVSEAYEAIQNHDKGIMLLDINRNQIWGPGMPITDAFQHADKKVEMIVNDHLCQIYVWNRISEDESGRLPVYNPK